MKSTGKPSAVTPHAGFDEAGAGNVAWSRCCDTRRRKGESTGNTKFDLPQRASPRPYLGGAEGETPSAYSTHVILAFFGRSKMSLFKDFLYIVACGKGTFHKDDLLASAVPPYAPILMRPPFGSSSSPMSAPGSPASIHGLVTLSVTQPELLPESHRPARDFK